MVFITFRGVKRCTHLEEEDMGGRGSDMLISKKKMNLLNSQLRKCIALKQKDYFFFIYFSF